MEHWFDSLARPHSRRTTVRGAALAGAALLVPALRIPRASATEGEPCFAPCVAAAAATRQATDNGVCKGIGGEQLLHLFLSVTHLGAVALAYMARGNPLAQCWATSELTWHRDVLACRGSECGDSSKYPSGKVKKPAQKCTPVEEKQCGDICCYVTTDCCLKNGEYVCYATGHNCGADTAGG